MKYLIQCSKWNGREINLPFDTEKEFLEEACKYFKEPKFKAFALTEYEFDEKFNFQQKISKLIDKKFDLFRLIKDAKSKLTSSVRGFESQQDILNEKGIETYINEINSRKNKISELDNELYILNVELENMRKNLKDEDLNRHLQRDLLCCHQCLPDECCAIDCKNNTEYQSKNFSLIQCSKTPT